MESPIRSIILYKQVLIPQLCLTNILALILCVLKVPKDNSTIALTQFRIMGDDDIFKIYE